MNHFSRMNKISKVFLWCWIAALAAALLFPPWLNRSEQTDLPEGRFLDAWKKQAPEDKRRDGEVLEWWLARRPDLANDLISGFPESWRNYQLMVEAGDRERGFAFLFAPPESVGGVTICWSRLGLVWLCISAGMAAIGGLIALFCSRKPSLVLGLALAIMAGMTLYPPRYASVTIPDKYTTVRMEEGYGFIFARSQYHTGIVAVNWSRLAAQWVGVLLLAGGMILAMRQTAKATVIRQSTADSPPPVPESENKA